MKCGHPSCRNLRSRNSLLLLPCTALGWTLHQHVIEEVFKEVLGPHRFDPHNPPPTATYLFYYTVVLIAVPLYNFNVRACSIPAMKCGHRSVTICDLGNPVILAPLLKFIHLTTPESS
jgi:hypothetical protein